MDDQESPTGGTFGPLWVKTPGWVKRVRRVRDFVYRVVAKADEDNIFFMGGAISFNLLVAFPPLAVLALGISGYVVNARFTDPAEAIVGWLVSILPSANGSSLDLSRALEAIIGSLVSERGALSVTGAVFLVWVSTRLVGTLRTVLREVFDIAQDRGIIKGKLFDTVAVMVGGVLIFLNVGVTIFIQSAGQMGLGLLNLQGEQLRWSQWLLGQAVAYISVWVLFLLTYRTLTARPVPWRTAVVAATVTALGFELLKGAFSWYVVSVADYGSTYGNLATIFILFLWIYYSALVFILGGEIAQVYTMRRVRNKKSEKARSAGGRVFSVLVPLALLCGPVGVRQAQAQGPGQARALEPEAGVVYSGRALEREVELDLPLLDHQGPYIVVHLAENRVFVMEQGEAIFSAPAGTGNGFRLAGGGKRWKFTTPRGLFKLRRKEKDPLWEAPDWHYVEKGLPIPPDNHPSRLMPGVMGTTALYLGDGIAIHGTNQPGLLLDPDPEARRVSHGCIRLTNEAARTLYHLVEVGTPVLIY